MKGGNSQDITASSKSYHIIYYIYYDDLAVLGPYLYAFKMWAEKGFQVFVYSLHDECQYNKIPETFSRYFDHHFVSQPFWIQLITKLFYLSGAVFNKLHLKTPLKEFAKLIKMAYFARYCFSKTDKSGKNILFAADPPGLYAASLIYNKNKSPYIYSIRELFPSADITNFADKIIKYFERKANKNALLTLEFDSVRAEMQKNDNKLMPESIMVVPNAPPGEAECKKMQYFHEKFGIDRKKMIVLYTGGIADYNLTYQIVESTKSWPPNVVLVVHCWGRLKEIEKLKQFTDTLSTEVYLSTERVLFDDIQEIYSSSDIGLALYGDQDLNHKYAGLSSGKLFNFMKACVPVITNDTPACREAIESKGCGICIEDISEKGPAIRKILNDESMYTNNCKKTFSKYEFSHNYQKVIDVLQHYVSNQKEC